MRSPISNSPSSILLISTCLLLLLGAGCSKKSSHTTKVTVAGEALTRVEPDTAVLSVSVVTQSPQAATAQQENARKSDAVAAAVKTIAGARVEIKTSDYTLQPQYDPRATHPPKIIGYDARNSVIVTLSDLKAVGAVIDAASKAGANSIDGISFVLQQTSPARGQALADATQQAMNKARSIAGALGGRVLRVVEESESATVAGDGRAVDYGLINAESIGMNGKLISTPITAGQLNIRANIQLIVEIES